MKGTEANFQTKSNNKWPFQIFKSPLSPLNGFSKAIWQNVAQSLVKNHHIIEIHGQEPSLRPNIYTSSFFKSRNEANLGASAGTGVPRNTHKIETQCGCEYGYKYYESFGSLSTTFNGARTVI